MVLSMLRDKLKLKNSYKNEIKTNKLKQRNNLFFCSKL